MWSALDSLPGVFNDTAVRAAVLVPLYADDDDEMRVILTRRPDWMATHPGDIVFPGGRLEDGETPVDAALREAWEEIGLPAEASRVLGGLDPVTTRRREDLIVPVVVRTDRPEELVRQPEEVDVIIEPRVLDLLDEHRWRTEDFYGHALWFFDFPEGVLWGASAFIMRNLLGYLR